MSRLAETDEIFFHRAGLARGRASALVAAALAGMDDGELFLEYRQSESLVLEDGQVKSTSFETRQGFGLRAVSDERVGYAHGSDLSEAALRRAGEAVRAVKGGAAGAFAPPPGPTNRVLYDDLNPLSEVPLAEKLAALSAIDAYARRRDPRVCQVIARFSASWQAVEIIRPDGARVADVRPLVRLDVTVMVADGGRREAGSDGAGGRLGYGAYLAPGGWQRVVDEALRRALVNLEAVPAPAGEMPVVLGPGWPGVLLHEAVGHGLEGDFNRKKTSAFSGRIGERVGTDAVTVVDDGTLPERRGSLSIDDEGTPTGRTVLIENGVLRGYLTDRLNARLLGMAPTGNGRRESFAHMPIPRMTNTFMLAGGLAPEEVIGRVARGLYAVHFGGGQVDITSGKFVFSASEAYMIENGRPTRPVKGASLIGHGPEVLKHVAAVAGDLALDPGIGTCGKDGQGVPVGVGLPTVLVERLTVGGTDAG